MPKHRVTCTAFYVMMMGNEKRVQDQVESFFATIMSQWFRIVVNMRCSFLLFVKKHKIAFVNVPLGGT